MLIRSNTGAVRRFLHVAGCSLLALAMALPPRMATAQLPGLGDGSEMSAGAERRLGDRIARQLYRDPDYFDDPVLVEYLQTIWDALLQGSRERGEMSPELDERFAWQLLMGRDKEVNAFALPGGYMGVYAGLIAITTSRDELASVLAHELSHITQRHISRLMTQQGRTTPLLLAALLLGMLAASKNPQAAGAMMAGSTAVAAQLQLNFSRDMEREADRVGYGVLVQAGFDGRGFSSMFEKLQMASNLNDNGNYPYLRSHPLTSERIADMRSRVPLEAVPLQATSPAPPAPAAAPAPSAAAGVAAGGTGREIVVTAARSDLLEHALVAARARVVSRSGAVDTLRAWANEPGLSGFSALPRLRQAPALYASALANVQQHDFDAARRHVARLAALVADDARAARLARLLSAEIELGAREGARVVALLTPPGATAPPTVLPRPELVLLAQATQHGGVVPDLTSRLQSRVASHPQDATAWQLLADSYRKDGQPLRAVRAEAEAQVAHLDWAGAIDRYRAGQELMHRGGPGTDYVEASIIDTRLREAESRLREDAAER
ncbi:MAG: M48 family metalloprotease [Pseudomonadota bacterium]